MDNPLVCLRRDFEIPARAVPAQTGVLIDALARHFAHVHYLPRIARFAFQIAPYINSVDRIWAWAFEL